MGTPKDTIRKWIAEGKDQGATHTIIACDTYDWVDFPVHVMPGEDVNHKYREYNGPNMQKVMEVYAHHLDHEAQLNEFRAFHFEYPPA